MYGVCTLASNTLMVLVAPLSIGTVTGDVSDDAKVSSSVALADSWASSVSADRVQIVE